MGWVSDTDQRGTLSPRHSGQSSHWMCGTWRPSPDRVRSLAFVGGSGRTCGRQAYQIRRQYWAQGQEAAWEITEWVFTVIAPGLELRADLTWNLRAIKSTLKRSVNGNWWPTRETRGRDKALTGQMWGWVRKGASRALTVTVNSAPGHDLDLQHLRL